MFPVVTFTSTDVAWTRDKRMSPSIESTATSPVTPFTSILPTTLVSEIEVSAGTKTLKFAVPGGTRRLTEIPISFPTTLSRKIAGGVVFARRLMKFLSHAETAISPLIFEIVRWAGP